MAQTRRSASRHKYSVLLPTYKERDNIAIIIWLIIRSFEQWRAPPTPDLTHVKSPASLHVLRTPLQGDYGDDPPLLHLKQCPQQRDVISC